MDESKKKEFELWLKVGARVLMTANDTNHRYYNGSMGTIIKFSSDTIVGVPLKRMLIVS